MFHVRADWGSSGYGIRMNFASETVKTVCLDASGMFRVLERLSLTVIVSAQNLESK